MGLSLEATQYILSFCISPRPVSATYPSVLVSGAAPGTAKLGQEMSDQSIFLPLSSWVINYIQESTHILKYNLIHPSTTTSRIKQVSSNISVDSFHHPLSIAHWKVAAILTFVTGISFSPLWPSYKWTTKYVLFGIGLLLLSVNLWNVSAYRNSLFFFMAILYSIVQI